MRSSKWLVYNSIFIGILFLYFLLKGLVQGTYVNFIYWPGADLLSMGLVSTLIPGKVLNRKMGFRWEKVSGLMIYAFLLGSMHILLSGFFTLILERFFRLEEHYSLSSLVIQWRNQWFLVVEWAFIYFFYQLIFLYLKQRDQLINHQRQILDLEKAVGDSTLISLRAELNPHFLYNAMNSISMTIRMGANDKAVSMIASLNELLRVVAPKKEEKFITLADEVELLNKYLSIETLRFGDRVKVELTIDPTTHLAQVPQLILQPLVENAFKHGMAESLENQHIVISSEKREENLVLRVFNTVGQNSQAERFVTSGEGIGLRNSVFRLKQLYGTRFKFLVKHFPNGIEFSITFPFTFS